MRGTRTAPHDNTHTNINHVYEPRKAKQGFRARHKTQSTKVNKAIHITYEKDDEISVTLGTSHVTENANDIYHIPGTTTVVP